MSTPGITVVLGAGGTRGIALAAVLRRLEQERIPVDTIIGCSVGAIVGAAYAGLGMTPDEMIDAARELRPWSLACFALSRWRVPFLRRPATRWAGAIPGYVERLHRAHFDRLHHGVRRLGILTYDLRRREELLVYGGAGVPAAVPLGEAVKASAAVPGLFPPLVWRAAGGLRLLCDAGWHTAVPIERAFAPPVNAGRVLAVDLSIRLCLRQRHRGYWRHLQDVCGDRLVILRPQVRGCATIVPGRDDYRRLVEAGERSVTPETVAVLRGWSRPQGAPDGPFLDTPRIGC